MSEFDVLIKKHKYQVQTITNLSKISLIGSGFRSNKGLNQQVWQLLKETEIFLFSHNELSLSVLVHNWEAATVRTKLTRLVG
jgi:aspartokinase